MLYFNKNYYHNRLFLIDNKYYVYVYITKNNYIYDFKLIENDLFFYIQNKNKKIREDFSVKIMYNNKQVKLNINGQKTDYINLGNINTFKFKCKKIEDNININDEYFEKNLINLFPNFNIDYYKSNNKHIKNINNNHFIKYHWYLSGRFNPQNYYKYLLLKHKEIIENLNYPKINYNITKNNTLLFIDDRYDSMFYYLLILFLNSIDNSWNLTIFTSKENQYLYESDLNKLKIKAKFNFIDKKIDNYLSYSKILMDSNFWNKIKEENCLLFQYDSFCSGKFKDIFFNYNYIGALWPHKPLNNNKINIGNGGTSFRKTRIMEKICKKYKDENIAEDLFFAEKLTIENLHNCNEEIAKLFSFENIFNDESIYAHQIYNTISLDNLNDFINKKLNLLLKIN